MVILKVTSKGQITLRKDLLQHLGTQPGDQVELDVLPGGKLTISAVSADKSWDGFIGLFRHKATRPYSIDEINEAIAAGWAGEIET